MRFDTPARLLTREGSVRLSLALAVARSPWQRFRGLMARPPLERCTDVAQALLFRACTSVHGCFVRQPLDVIYLDADQRVSETVRLRRFGWSIASRAGAMPQPRHTLELPMGSVEGFGIRPGDLLQIDAPAPRRSA